MLTYLGPWLPLFVMKILSSTSSSCKILISRRKWVLTQPGTILCHQGALAMTAFPPVAVPIPMLGGGWSGGELGSWKGKGVY